MKRRDHRRMWPALISMALLVTTACSPAAPNQPSTPATNQPATATSPAATPILIPTDTPVVTALEPSGQDAEATVTVPLTDTASAGAASVTVAAPTADWTQTASMEGDLFILGNPDAPVRLLDYSDFL